VGPLPVVGVLVIVVVIVGHPGALGPCPLGHRTRGKRLRLMSLVAAAISRPTCWHPYAAVSHRLTNPAHVLALEPALGPLNVRNFRGQPWLNGDLNPLLPLPGSRQVSLPRRLGEPYPLARRWKSPDTQLPIVRRLSQHRYMMAFHAMPPCEL
jgi:hypothetical protein